MNKCRACGGELEGTNLKGRSFPFMNVEKLVLTHNFHAPACKECDNWALEGNRAKTLDRALILSLCDFYKENLKLKNYKRMVENWEDTVIDLCKDIGDTSYETYRQDIEDIENGKY